VASGKVGASRLPRPWLPAGLRLTGVEAAGEVQTPVTGPAARSLRIGDRVWFRHAKAGELCERVNNLHLIDGDRVTDTVPTYRGEEKAFL
ncbi:MAG: amino acid deaminase/aldolase, partial [Stackebrandtia sp.]